MSYRYGTQIFVLLRVECHTDNNTDTKPQFDIRFNDIGINDFQKNIRLDISLMENVFYPAPSIKNLVIKIPSILWFYIENQRRCRL